MKSKPYVLDERQKWRKFKALQDKMTKVAVANGTQRFSQLYAALEAFLGIIEASGVPIISEAPWTQRKDSICSDTGTEKLESDEDESIPETQLSKPDEIEQKYVAYKKALEREAKELAKKKNNLETKNLLDKRIDLSSESGPVVKFLPSLDKDATVYSESIIGTMTRFHQKRKYLKNVDACLKWIVAQTQKRSVAVDRVDGITSALRAASVYASIKIRDNEVCFLYELLAFRSGEWLNDMCIRLAIQVMTQDRSDIAYVDGAMFEHIQPNEIHLNESLCDVSDRQSGMILIPMSIENKHWCLLIVDINTKDIIQLDHMQRRPTYSFLSKTCKSYVAPLLRGKYADYTIKKADNIRQEDGHNCGVLVIHYMESYISTRVVRNPNAVLVQSIRLAYFVQGLRRLYSHKDLRLFG
ncbi:hypothetical protein L917_17773 [Phytophthora nicotianae]|uniref:Ubiquitin-like protease family profile domain-containing protein n=1 Tax=Phytophthora nicotianae TaxID=4792 RepID=W2K9T3_PHYNI|nr:hypothetical protein L917_17773 [Phytophthora nicotianae]